MFNQRNRAKIRSKKYRIISMAIEVVDKKQS